MTRQYAKANSQPHSHVGVAAAMLPKQRYETVTPKIARDWLRHNTANRPLSRSSVEKLKRVFERGEWQITHQGVGFGLDGVLQDGQHRLTALSEMPEGFSVTMSVTRGLPKAAYETHDQGRKRSYSDALTISQGLAEVSRFLAAIVVGNSLSPQTVRTYVELFEPYYDTLIEGNSGKSRTWSTASVRAAGVIAIARGIDASYVRDVYRALVTADFNAMPSVAQALFRAELNGRVKAQEKLDMFVRALKIFNPANAKQSKVQIMDTSTDVAEVREFINSVHAGARLPGV